MRSENVRVSRDEFLEVWEQAHLRTTGAQPLEGDDWYAWAVAQTYRWLAAAPMRSALCGGLPRSPVTGRACLAHHAVIEAEWQSAGRREDFCPDLAARSGWQEGVRATLGWAWIGEGLPPYGGRSGVER